ncbi:DUF2254 domain-containing protein [Aridibaculum aurantiacum]|uniref:DUF2254 domain-containing protein n=1 Tax=Aridibaculum aurantiacum TaxID=2810307 RepID=UPI001A95B4AF|nr:DUF2254 domain-containing protein [Aridibaculum aurantiacum]
MSKAFIKWIKLRFERVVTSIAFYPVIIATCYLLLSVLMVAFDFSETGKDLKSDLDWVRLKDASTARSIISAIAAGIISLTVFSFSMVMIVLNQAASQMSNRVLDNLIGNRFQQVILGIYIGTIVYSLFLLSTIRDIDSGIYIPAISIYLLIVLTIVDIFLFIYFLHYITQSVKYETIIHRIYEKTLASMKSSCRLDEEPVKQVEGLEKVNGQVLYTPDTGIYQGIDKDGLLNVCNSEDLLIKLLHAPGTFLTEGTAYAVTSKKIDDNLESRIRLMVNIHRGDAIDSSYYNGIRQLVEVAIKALSPGINDPGTAISSLRALASILIYRLKHFPDTVIKDDEGKLRIITTERSAEEIVEYSLLPIWDYGKEDRLLRNELRMLVEQLSKFTASPILKKLAHEVHMANTRDAIVPA